ncbi:MAG TPA: hypothetical protein VIT20_11915 [Propionibacteriaceae bacterium]
MTTTISPLGTGEPAASRRSLDTPVDPAGQTWANATTVVAVVGVALIAMRIQLPRQLTVGDVFALALLPVWFPVTRRYVPARLVMVFAALTIPAGAILTLRSAVDHETSLRHFIGPAFWMIGLIACIGFLLWARERLGTTTVAVVFGVGMLVGLDTGANLFSSNPWKFGFSVPVTVLALALAHKSGKRWLELTVAMILTTICFFTDARSSFGILLLTTTLMAWQLRPASPTRKASAARSLLGLSAVLVSVYYIGQGLILSGVFGAATKARTEAQLHEAGSLIFGGRPELFASMSLIRDNPLGPGAGTLPNFHEVAIAKSGMSTINYDPNNGYVENWMFGNGYSLHSMFGDLWAQWGLMGLIFTGLVLVITVRRLAYGVSAGNTTALVLFLSCLTLWNVFFAPWYSGLRLLELLMALGLMRRPDADLSVASRR